MKSMSSADIAACVSELQQLVGGKVEKIYHHPPDEIRVKIYAGGRKDLILEAGRRIHLTKFPRESPRIPSSFAMLLRKHLEGGRVRKIEQHDFDRVVVIEVEREKRNFIIVELFSKGNVILADESFRIIMPLKPFFKPGEVYRFPEPRTTPFELNSEKLAEIFRDEDKEVVRILARSGLGGLYAEEVCLRAGINKNKVAKELNEEEIEKIAEAIDSIFGAIRRGAFTPHIVSKDGEYIDVLPIELQIYDGLERKYFPTFNEALDEYYARRISEVKQEESEELKKLKARLEKQLETKKEFENEMERYRAAGDAVYENYQLLEQILEAFRQARQQKSWDEIKKIVRAHPKLSKLVVEIHPEKNSVVVNIGPKIELALDKNLPQIADVYYERAKKVRQKLEGLLKAIEKTKEEMQRVEELEAKKYVKGLRVARKREWFERFRWFITSDGFLVIGGRNAAMNEEIVSKYMEPKDLFFHTQTPGAPATVLKLGQEAPETSIIEAAQFAATYSALWKEGKYSGEVYYVKPEQVKRAAKHGEYLARGSFYIEGKRNYLTVAVSCAVGVEVEKLRVLGGPTNAVKKYCDYYVELDIGNMSANEISVEIARKLVEMAKEEERHIVRSIATPDEIMKFLPPGKSRIKK
ncbi:ribosome rescue protein RqcH [Archaeoglobus veneficus]|uniref:Fibronectin-binding A domain protein n=1 Tax=Archaeoglobus veneficus (strain DSM 11195 / SNP6) TaxID=693661 RepID=F2KN09_ARCVS|nr:ribosome rescue protein RqcH [Archaeoglobus veneficus]AEA47285.1 Fibronectin-binding A domain protein [Archaeoglobus veneficus SNP6]